ncbi:HMG box protein [Staphylotrichum tortipilum]|uniref:HMG box protein n=1 Tax=Staphylotrichum tortipilum TaxID=2831512 RepID=A0AAN6MLC5_9PEZI|nr:HMG box protein [Staphylotrichum longicolle]
MAMAARPVGVSGASSAAAAREEAPAKPRVSETSPTSAGATPLSSASSVSSSSSSSATTTVPAGPPSPTSPPPVAAAAAAAGSSESPRRPITKKRAASINTEEANRPKIEHLNLTTPGTASPRPFDTSNAFICLCTPPPKVPRPRNAFILYRQHHQSEVVQQNPGLANPDISKIIGEKWREEPEECKNLWKQLAEEEKQRHQRQYPDYRYQPRRGNKAGGSTTTGSGSSHSARPAAPGEDPHRCAKCGGRYIATPRTPSTPFMTPTSASSSKPSSSAPYGPPFPSRADMTGRYGPGGRPVHWGSASSSASSSGLHDIREDYDMPPLEAKRRRVTTSASSVPGGGGGSYHNFHALPSPPPTASSFPHHHPHPQPTPASCAPPPTGSLAMRTDPGPMMPPPRRPPHSLPTGHYPVPVPHRFARGGAPTQAGGGTGSASDFDESLRLPPLQTRHLDTTNLPPATTPSDPGTAATTGSGLVNPTPTIPWHHHHHGPPNHHSSHPPTSAASSSSIKIKRDRDSTSTQRDLAAAAAKSVEAMVMSISPLSKLRVLERISPRLGGCAQRGPVVAVEGADARAVKAVGGVIERALRGAVGTRGWEVRCWEGDNLGESMVGDGSVGAGDGFTGCLRAITEWHGRSAEITQFVTGGGGGGRLSTSSASSSGTTTTTTPSTTSTSDPNATDSEAPPTPRARHPLPTHPASTTTTTTTTQPEQNTPSPTLPIALLPAGFSLTLADRFACAVPISDAYAPVDHWQWMATLWRGIVAPDLVVYVTGPAGGGKVGEEGGVGGMGGGQAQVEVCDAGLMVVRVPASAETIESAASSAASAASFPGVVEDEKMERRLGFEVVEWVRGGGWVGLRRGNPSSVGLMES